MGCAPPRQPRTATCDLSADAPHQLMARSHLQVYAFDFFLAFENARRDGCFGEHRGLHTPLQCSPLTMLTCTRIVASSANRGA
jgi:hypothetical protein